MHLAKTTSPAKTTSSPSLTYTGFAVFAGMAGVAIALVALGLDWGVWTIFGVTLLVGVSITGVATVRIFGRVTRDYKLLTPEERLAYVAALGEEVLEPEKTARKVEQEIQRALELLDSGVLSREEFEALNRRLRERGA
jgi:hypothetical protein